MSSTQLAPKAPTPPATPPSPRRSLEPTGFARLGKKAFPASLMVLAAVVVFLAVYPLGKLFISSTDNLDAWGELFAQPWFGGMLFDTLFVVLVSSVISVVIGALLAWVSERTDAGMGTLGDALPLVPLFLPAVAMAIGWVILASPEVGLLSPILEPLGLQIYSLTGLVFVYVLLGVPYTYLPVVAALKSLDPALEEAARMSKAGVWRVVRTVTLPAVGPSLMSGFLLVTITSSGLYSLPAIVGLNTEIDIMSVRIVQSIQNTYPVDYTTSVMLSTLLFAGLLVLFVIQKRMIGGNNYARMGGHATKVSRTQLGVWRWPVRLMFVSYIVFAAVLPLGALLIVSFQGFWQPDLLNSTWTLANFDSILSKESGIASLRNSLVLSLGTGVVVVLLSALVIIYGRQNPGRLSRAVLSIAKMPAAVPGSVLAVAFIFGFGGPPFNLGGTLLIMGLAYFVLFLPYAAISLEASAAQIGENLEDAASLSGASSGKTFIDIVIPLLRPGLFAAFALVFVRVIGDLAVAALLGSGQTPLVSAVLFETWSQGFFTQVAALALVMTLITAVVVMLMMKASKPKWARTPKKSASK